MSSFIVHGKIVFIYGGRFGDFPNVTRKIKAMHGVACGAVLDRLCSKKCTLVLYIDIKDLSPAVKRKYGGSITEKNLEWPYYENIRGFMTIELLETHSEIFNVCIDPYARGKGIAKELFNATLNVIPTQWGDIWLGIKLDNPTWGAALHVYISAGFTNPVIANVTPSGATPGFPFLALFFRKGINTSNPPRAQIKAVEQNANYLRDTFLAEQNICQMNIHASSGLMKIFHDNIVVPKNVEYGGALAVVSERDGVYELGVPEGSITEGNRETFIVAPPVYWINWHTHPHICYKANRCYIGWPSGPDMGYTIKGYVWGIVSHMVFTGEGVYIIQLTPGMMKFMSIISKDQNCINAIAEVIAGRFGELEQFRNIATNPEKFDCIARQDIACLIADSHKKDEFMDLYLTLASTATFQDMFEWSKILIGAPNIANQEQFSLLTHAATCLQSAGAGDNFPIFSVKFERWDTLFVKGLTSALMYLNPPQNAKCPIPIYDKQQFGPTLHT